jgi:poly(3-hydroxyalkanoate) synthetase
VTGRFELFIAGRYLRARRKAAVISVITAISVLGVAAGVMALVIALADHISPTCQSESIMTKVSSQDQFLLKVKGGHIGMMAGSGALKFTWPHIDSWLAARSE